MTQVEECKVITRMMPILLSTILMNTCMGQLQTFSVVQGQMMDLTLEPTSTFPPLRLLVGQAWPPYRRRATTAVAVHGPITGHRRISPPRSPLPFSLFPPSLSLYGMTI